MIAVEDFVEIEGFIDGLRPEPRLTVTEWADAHRKLDSKAAAEPGDYRSSRTPYWVEPMNMLSVTSLIRKVVIMKGAQVGATEIGLNFMGYVIDVAPGPFLGVMPTQDTMERNSKGRIAPMIEASPNLRAKIKDSKSKNSGNTINNKDFPGGVLALTGANSGAGLRSMPARYLMLDEVDGYPMDVEGEGSPIGLAEQRSATFPNRKILELSTPTIQGLSIIEAEFLLTDQRYYNIPCPFCGGSQVLKFNRLKWTAGVWEDAAYQCEHCEDLIPERYKPLMLAGGVWIPTAPEKSTPYTVGYHLSALYSPYGWKSWAEIAEQWEKAQGDDTKLKQFYNTVLGETWKQRSDAPAWEVISRRAEDYPHNTLRPGVAFITAGVDVQKDRLEIEIVGWMPGFTSHQVDYRVLLGDTEKKEVWAELDKVIKEVWPLPDGGALPIRMVAVDTGYLASTVYKWARRHGFSKVVPIKGQESLQNYFSPPRAIDVVKHGKKVNKQKVWHVGVNFIKQEIYGNLRQEKDEETGSVPDGYCFLPKRDSHYFRGLTAEVQEVVRDRKGYLKYIWKKKYERNEPLDCRVYARAAASIIGADRWTVDRWEREAGMHVVAPVELPSEQPSEEAQPVQVAQTMPAKRKKEKRAKRSSFWNR